MPSNSPKFTYDIFISYRQKDNKYDGWVTEFVENLRSEIDATFKEDISIYFDSNPHDGLLENHDVDRSLGEKIKCQIFIPVISQTYCDPKCFAWNNELLPFLEFARHDPYGLDIRLANGNVAKRVVPIRIHEIDHEDEKAFEQAVDGVLRPFDFIYKSSGVNRPLRSSEDHPDRNQAGTYYRDQINKVANAIKQLRISMREGAGTDLEPAGQSKQKSDNSSQPSTAESDAWQEIKRRNVHRAGAVYIVLAWLIVQITEAVSRLLTLPAWLNTTIVVGVIVGFPMAMILAWKFEKGPDGFVPVNSKKASENPFTPSQRKPFTNNLSIFSLLALIIIVSIANRVVPGSIGYDFSQPTSIAVVPFRNYTGQADFDNFGFGIASEIRTQLALSKQFEFISSEQATMKYANTADDPLSIGQSLNVNLLLIGNFQKAGENIKISMELVDCSNGKTLMTLPTYFTQFASFSELFKIQTDIASKVITQISGKVIANPQAPTTEIAAFTNYNLGKKFTSKGWFFEQDIITAIDYYEKAIAIDSSYLEAWVGLADVIIKHHWSLDQDYYEATDTTITLGRAKEIINHINVHFKETWHTLYLNAIYEYRVNYNYEKAKGLFERVLEINPDDDGSLGGLMAINRRQINNAEAAQYAMKCIAIAPLDPQNWFELSYVFMGAGDTENRLAAAAKGFELDPNGSESISRIYNSFRSAGHLFDLPKAVKAKYKEKYRADSLVDTENWQGLLTYLKTVKPVNYANDRENNTRIDSDEFIQYKVTAFYNLGLKDSVKKYAPQLEREDFRKSWTGDVNGALASIEENFSKNLVDGGDKILYVIREQLKIRVLATNGRYEEATQQLQGLADKFPKNGLYFIMDLPEFAKIKKEYAPFNQLAQQLTAPRNLIVGTELEKLKY